MLGKAPSAGVRGLAKAATVYGLVLLLGIEASWDP
jgi:hypothetical protein